MTDEVKPLTAEMAKQVYQQAWPAGFTRTPKTDERRLAVGAIATGQHGTYDKATHVVVSREALEEVAGKMMQMLSAKYSWSELESIRAKLEAMGGKV